MAKLLGYMSYGFLAVEFGTIHYRHLKRQKIEALAFSKGNFEASTSLSAQGKDDIRWWRDNIMDAYEDIYKKEAPVLYSLLMPL